MTDTEHRTSGSNKEDHPVRLWYLKFCEYFF